MQGVEPGGSRALGPSLEARTSGRASVEVVKPRVFVMANRPFGRLRVDVLKKAQGGRGIAGRMTQCGRLRVDVGRNSCPLYRVLPRKTCFTHW